MTTPNEFCRDHAGFGLDPDVQWVNPGDEPGRRGELRAAYAQHQAVRTVRDALVDRRLSTRDLARALGQDEGQLLAALRGETVASLAELAAWKQLLSPELAAGSGAVRARAGDDPDKRLDGRYLTAVNPFFHPAFLAWFDRLGDTPRLVEPFAGANALPRMMAAIGLVGDWGYFDITPLDDEVLERDTLADFPVGYDAVVTNPPYLSRHFARRKGLAVDHLPWGVYNNLYKVALDRCLANAGYVAAIIPESFVTTGLFTERLTAVVSLTSRMFDDTEMPTCLALWRPEAQDDFEVWRGPRMLGMYSDLAQQLELSADAGRITFNDPAGSIGLKAIDATSGPSIAFVPAAEIPVEKIKHSARLVSRIRVDGLDEREVPAVIVAANQRLDAYRVATGDVLLTAFKGLRVDGQFRRRLDFDTARRVLALGVEDVVGTARETGVIDGARTRNLRDHNPTL